MSGCGNNSLERGGILFSTDGLAIFNDSNRMITGGMDSIYESKGGMLGGGSLKYTSAESIAAMQKLSSQMHSATMQPTTLKALAYLPFTEKVEAGGGGGGGIDSQEAAYLAFCMNPELKQLPIKSSNLIVPARPNIEVKQ